MIGKYSSLEPYTDGPFHNRYNGGALMSGWGSSQPAEEAGYAQLTSQFVQDVAPHLQSFSAISDTLTDPVRQIAVLESQLQAARASGASLSRITLLEGKLNAAKIRMLRRQEGDQSTRMWRNLGMLGAGAGVVLVGAITFAILKRSLAA